MLPLQKMGGGIYRPWPVRGEAVDYIYDKEYKATYYQKNKARIKANTIKYSKSEKGKASQKKGNDKYRASDKGRISLAKYREKHKDRIKYIMRRGNLFRRRGITLEEYDGILLQQNGVCAICGTTDTGRAGVFHVDHCHQSGAVRGLLCNKCNTGLGMFRESAIVLEKALCYMGVSLSARGA